MSYSTVVIAVGVLMVVGAIGRGAFTGVKGLSIFGSVTGTFNQTTTISNSDREAKPKSGRDKILWVIGIVGVGVAVFGIYLAHIDAVHG